MLRLWTPRGLISALTVLVAVVALAPAASASGSGGWRRTGDLRLGRVGHTATALLDGSVLIVGMAGNADYDEVAADNRLVERLDPASGAVTQVPSLRRGRAHHGAQLLPDGDVLIFGGEDADGGRVGASERYDVATGSWLMVGSLARPRSHAMSTTLADGRVLVVGGYSADGTVPAPEIFDPTTNAWSVTAAPAEDHRVGTLTTLADGSVLLAGGYEGYWWEASTTVERFDPAAGQWSRIADMPVARGGHRAVLLDDGQLLIAGGLRVRTDLYNPVTDAWTHGHDLPATSTGEMTALTDGRVLLAGGSADSGSGSQLTFLYDNVTGEWDRGPGLRRGREHHTLTALAGGGAAIVGGGDPSYGISTRETEVFHPSRAPMPQLSASLQGPAMPGSYATLGVTLHDEEFAEAMRGEQIRLEVDGVTSEYGWPEQHCEPYSCSTDDGGAVELSYYGPAAGTDQVTIWADFNQDYERDAHEPTMVLEVVWERLATTLRVGPLVGVRAAGSEAAPRELRATLKTVDGDPVYDAQVSFYAGTQLLCSAYTYDGVASCYGVKEKAQAIASSSYRAVFAGNDYYAPSEGRGSITP